MKSARLGLYSLFAICFLIDVFMVFPILPAADTWMYCASGGYFTEELAKGRPLLQVIGADPFCFSTAGRRWVDHEWLLQIIFAAVAEHGGLTLLYALRSVILLAAFTALPALVYAEHIKKRCSELKAWSSWLLFAALNTLVLCCADGFRYFDARGYIVTYLLLAYAFYIMAPFFDAEQTPEELSNTNICKLHFVIFPLASAFAANCHGAYIVAPLVMFFTAFLLLLKRYLKQCLSLSMLALLSLAASAVLNPFGAEILLFPFSMMEHTVFKAALNEWQAPVYSQSLYLYIEAALYIAAFRRMGLLERAVGFCLLAAAFAVWRHAPLCALGLAFILQRPLLTAFRPILKKAEVFFREGFKSGILGTAVGGAAVFGVLFLSFVCFCRLYSGSRVWTGESRWFCKYAADFMAANPQLSGRLYNPYEWGGYLMLRLKGRPQTFIDGRAHVLFSEETYAQSLYLQYGENARQALSGRGFGAIVDCFPDRLTLLDSLKVDLALIDRPMDGGLRSLLLDSGRWQLIFEDDLSSLFIRSDPEHQKLISGLRQIETPYRITEEATAMIERRGFGQGGERAGLAYEMEPSYLRAGIIEAGCRWAAGQKSAAVNAVMSMLLKSGNWTGIFYGLGDMAKDNGCEGWASLYYAAGGVCSFYHL